MGYAKEAARAAVEIAFRVLCLHRLECGIDPKNKASLKVASGIGMKKEGLRRGYYFEESKWVGNLFYSIVPEDVGIRSTRPAIRTSLRDNLGSKR